MNRISGSEDRVRGTDDGCMSSACHSPPDGCKRWSGETVCWTTAPVFLWGCHVAGRRVLSDDRAGLLFWFAPCLSPVCPAFIGTWYLHSSALLHFCTAPLGTCLSFLRCHRMSSCTGETCGFLSVYSGCCRSLLCERAVPGDPFSAWLD